MIDPATRVMLIDDHRGVAEAFVEALSDRFEIVAIATSLRTATSLAERTHPDVIVADYLLPDGKGTDGPQRLSVAAPRARFVLLTGYSHRAAVADALEASFSAVVLKTAHLDELVSAIETAASGGSSYSTDALRPLMTSKDARGSGSAPTLTAREHEVLRCLADGSNTAEIASALIISQHTARNHVRSILAKLGAKSRLEAVAIARSSGII